jgi:protein gp37
MASDTVNTSEIWRQYNILSARDFGAWLQSVTTASEARSTAERPEFPAGASKIEWCDATWNPIVGCDRVGPECDHCYAATLASRGMQSSWREAARGGDWTGKVVPNTSPDAPRRWTSRMKKTALDTKWADTLLIFCASMSDIFHPHAPAQVIEKVFATVRETPHQYLMLTKRPANAGRVLDRLKLDRLPDNVWFGVTCGARVSRRLLDAARKIPATRRFVSVEPLLEPLPDLDLSDFHWVITGGESGRGPLKWMGDMKPGEKTIRRCHADWVRDVRDQVHAAGCAYFHKQWGPPENNPLAAKCPAGEKLANFINCIDRNGKGGALLDGRLWREFPR